MEENNGCFCGIILVGNGFGKVGIGCPLGNGYHRQRVVGQWNVSYVSIISGNAGRQAWNSMKNYRNYARAGL